MSTAAASGVTTSGATGELAQLLAIPPPAPAGQRWRAQSLAKGAAGIALLHIERAHLGAGSWATAHAWVKAAAAGQVSAADDAGLWFGAPAISFVLHTAAADGTARYGTALARIDPRVNALAHRRVDRAIERVGRSQLPVFAEYDLLRGLTGIGAHLLAHAPGSDALGRILACLVRLAQPLRVDGEILLGWWVSHDPRIMASPGFPGGHANLGMAHGISGPLALLGAAMRRGVTVDGQADAITGICAWLDTWQQESDAGPWWPQWITRADLRAGQPVQRGPGRPSWCYGTPGLARAQQLAAIAVGDTRRQRLAEYALARCLSDPVQLGRVTGTNLCHGWAGLYQTAWRVGRDALSPVISTLLPRLAELVIRHAHGQGDGAGLLEGDAGVALALHTAASSAPPVSGWDACLMIS